MVRATTLSDLWVGFKDLPWWKKVLLFIPFILVAAVMLVWAFSDSRGPQNVVLEEYNRQLDEKVEDFKKSSEERQKEIKKLEGEIDQLGKETKKKNDQYEKTINRIDNADTSDELIGIAEELRTKYSGTRTRDPKTNPTDGEGMDS